ncbi:hypothetical protein H257_17089, partial [Aphanomyces astaci]
MTHLVAFGSLIDHVVGNVAKHAKLVQAGLVVGEGLYRGRRDVGAVWYAVLDEHRCIHRFSPPTLRETGVRENGHGHLHDGTVSSFCRPILPLIVCRRRLVNDTPFLKCFVESVGGVLVSAVGSEDLDLPSCLRLGPRHYFREVGLLGGGVDGIDEANDFHARTGVKVPKYSQYANNYHITFNKVNNPFLARALVKALALMTKCVIAAFNPTSDQNVASPHLRVIFKTSSPPAALVPKNGPPLREITVVDPSGQAATLVFQHKIA